LYIGCFLPVVPSIKLVVDELRTTCEKLTDLIYIEPDFLLAGNCKLIAACIIGVSSILCTGKPDHLDALLVWCKYSND
jgi:hypothetical protein